METCKKIEKKIVGWKTVKEATPIHDASSRPTTINYIMAAKRPDELVCDIKKVKIAGEAWTIFVGLMDGKPYEVFGGLSKFVEIPKKYEQGKIVKTAKAYNLVYGVSDEETTIRDIANVFENPVHGAFTRSISLNLRHGVPPVYVVEQLQKDKNSDITSFSKVMARVLKGYIQDGTRVTGEKKCVQCSGDSLKYQEGCLTCLDCGWSKC